MNKLEQARTIINDVDQQMAVLWQKRMEAVKMVVEYKMEHGLAVYDAQREAENIQRNSALIEDEQLKVYYVEMLQMMMEISKKYQKEIMEK